MEYSAIEYSRTGRITTITLNRPHRMNAISMAMPGELAHAVERAYENMGLNNTQMVATLFDGITRHSPGREWFKQRAEAVGFKQAVAERDSGAPIAEDVSRSLSPYRTP